MLQLFNAFVGLILGAYVGKFITLVVDQLPIFLLDEEDVRELRDVFKDFFKSDSCRHCGKILPHFPIIGFLLLKGKCSACSKSLGVRGFLIELFTSLLFGGALFLFPFNLKLLFVLALLCILICCFFTDFDHGILPDQLTLSLVWMGLMGSLVPIFVSPSDAIIGAVGGYGIFWAFNELYRLLRGFDGMFPGDFKLNAGLGACLGIKWLMFITLTSFALLIVGAVIQVVSMQREDQAKILYKETPYGCYSSVVSAIVILTMLK